MSSFIVAVNGPNSGRKIFLTNDKYVMGRHPECDIIVEVGAVSRHHAQITKDSDSFFVEDLGSRNGTFVNEEKIEERYHLTDGDSIRICDIDFTFHKEEAFANIAGTIDHGIGKEETAFGSVVFDEEESTSTIMSKLEVSSEPGSVHLSASPEVKLLAMIEITKQLAGALTIEEVLPQVLNSIFKIFLQADRGFIIVREGEKLVPKWSKSRREGDDEVRISRTVVNHVIDSKEAILSADAASDSRFEMSQSITDFKIRSIMCAPLINSDGTAFGVIQVDTLDQRKRFQLEDLEVLVSIASQAAAAIDNANLHEQKVRQKTLDRDLKLANKVQIGFLPQEQPQLPNYEFYNYYLAANAVGGDYYDYIPLQENRLAILVGDVVGHGVAASLLMAKLSADARYCLASESDPATAINLLNSKFAQSIPDDQFVTLVINILDPINNTVTVLNAGHQAPLLRRTDGKIDMIAEEEINLPLGVIDGIEYEAVTVPIAPGESLTLFTDGLNEAMNSDGGQIGMDPIVEHCAKDHQTVEAMGESLIQVIREFMGDHKQFDDMCLVIYERKQ